MTAVTGLRSIEKDPQFKHVPPEGRTHARWRPVYIVDFRFSKRNTPADRPGCPQFGDAVLRQFDVSVRKDQVVDMADVEGLTVVEDDDRHAAAVGVQ